MTTPFLRLPFSFDPTALASDYGRCESSPWKTHFNASDFRGNWDGLALRSASGAPDDILAHPGSSYRDTPLMESCSFFRSVIDRFRCEKEGVRLLRLSPGAEIKEHRDLGAGYANGAFRIHVPVQTNPQVRFLVGGKDVVMLAGESWYADFGLPHRVRNEGEADRVHLVIDAIRNEWTDEVFREAGYDFEAETAAKALPLETRLKMVEHLLALDTQTSRDMAEKLRLEIEAERSGSAR